MPELAQISICFMNSATGWGGGEKWHFEMACELQKRGFQVSAIVKPKSKLCDKFIQTGITVFKLKVGNLSFLNLFKKNKLRKYFQKDKPDILIMNLPSDLKIGSYCAKAVGIKSIIYRRGSAIPIRNSYLNRHIFSKNITHIIANSEETKRTILKNNEALFDLGNIKVIYNGMQEPLHKSLNEINFKIKGDKLIIGNVARMVPQKGHYFLVDLAAELVSRGVDFEIHLAGDGFLMPEIKNKILNLGLNNSFVFHGFIHDLPNFYRAIDIFVLTSRWEGFGYVLTEAMAAGKPIVAFNLSSNPEIVKNEKTGYLVPSFNIKLLSDKVCELLNNEELRKQMGSDARLVVREKFTFEQSANKIEAFIKGIFYE